MDDINPIEVQQERDRRICNQRRCKSILGGIGFIICLVVIIGILVITLPKPGHTSLNVFKHISAIDHDTQPNVAQCGTTSTEAEAKGCIFDPLAAGYMPPACYDHNFFVEAQKEATSNLLSSQLNAPFEAYPTPETFEWFLDQNLTMSVAQEDLTKTTPFQAYTWERFHIAHCEYLATSVLNAARRIQQGEKNVYVNARALDEVHRKHCRYVLGEQIRRIGHVALVFFGYNNCTKLA